MIILAGTYIHIFAATAGTRKNIYYTIKEFAVEFIYCFYIFRSDHSFHNKTLCDSCIKVALYFIMLEIILSVILCTKAYKDIFKTRKNKFSK